MFDHDDRDYHFNARFDYIAELAAEHRDHAVDIEEAEARERHAAFLAAMTPEERAAWEAEAADPANDIPY